MVFNSPMTLKLTEEKFSQVTILIPCLNEGKTIANVVTNFKKQLPHATILVVDNGSLDNTKEQAQRAGASVVNQSKRGKGHAIETGLRLARSQYVIMCDGDSTYDPHDAKIILQELSNGYDMVVANRISTTTNVYRKGHRLGNRLLSMVQQKILGVKVIDTLSGYRGFTKNFVENFVASSSGFEIEANLNIFSAIVGARVKNFDSKYGARHEESSSKLNTIRDGMRILLTVTRLMFTWRPLLMYSLIGGLLLVVTFPFLFIPVNEFFTTGRVLHIPTLIVSTLAFFFAMTLFFLGLLSNQIVNFRIEIARRDFKIFD
jgi:glycosyltransferase involved in cell wall biosynthesis